MSFHWVQLNSNAYRLYKVFENAAGTKWGEPVGHIERIHGPTPGTWEIRQTNHKSLWKTCTLEEAKATLIAIVSL